MDDLEAAALEKLIEQRNHALINLDMDWARKTMLGASSDEVRLAAMHKARYEAIKIPRELRHASGQYLRENKLKRIGGLELLPEGELPC